MAKLNLNKKDIIWSYIAQFMTMGAGIITLPIILSKLSAQEIGLNYVFLTIGSVVSLVDLGFAPQFARNFTYVFSGAQNLEKEGIGNTESSINYELLAYLLTTARYVYLILAVIGTILLAVIGTPYVYKTTFGFTLIPNSLLIWIIYCLGILFQIFYSYYFSMLIGCGKIKEQKYALISNKVLNVSIVVIGLYSNLGLLSIALAQLIAPFCGRILSYRFFYTEKIKKEIADFDKKERKKIFEIYKVLWYNAKRSAVMQIGAYAILKFSMFIAGLYLSLEEFASYGLMTQLVGILGTVSCTYLQVSQTKFASLRAVKNISELINAFSFTLIIFYFIYIIGSVILIMLGQNFLILMNSNASLPSRCTVALYCLVMFLEYNHSNFAILISSSNHIPFAPASIITGLCVCLGIYFIVKFTNLGIFGLVLIQGICQGAYQNWKWPLVAVKEIKTSYFYILKIGLNKFRTFIHSSFYRRKII